MCLRTAWNRVETALKYCQHIILQMKHQTLLNSMTSMDQSGFQRYSKPWVSRKNFQTFKNAWEPWTNAPSNGTPANQKLDTYFIKLCDTKWNLREAGEKTNINNLLRAAWEEIVFNIWNLVITERIKSQKARGLRYLWTLWTEDIKAEHNLWSLQKTVWSSINFFSWNLGARASTHSLW